MALSQEKMREKLKNFGEIISAARRMVQFSFSVTPRYTLGFLFFALIIAVTPFLSAYVNSRVLDALVDVITTGGGITDNMILFISLGVGMIFVTGLVDVALNFFEQNFYFNITREFNAVVTQKFAYLDIEYYEDPETNNLLQKVKENYGHRPQEFVSITFFLLNSVLRIFSAVAVLVAFSPLLALFLLLTTLPRLLNNLLYGKRTWGIWDAKAEVKRDYWWSRNHLESENSLMELRIFKTRNYLLTRVYDLFFGFQKEQIDIERKRSLLDLVVVLVGAVGFGAVFFVTVMAAIAGKITIGLFSFYIDAARQLRNGFINLFRRMARFYEYGLYMVDIFKVLDLEERVVSGTVCLPDKDEAPLIEFKGASFTYPGTKKLIIDNLNLTIKPGEHVAIVGENGAGKTTLIKVLMRFYDLTEGGILIDGVSIKDLDTENWYSKVGTLFQEFNTYHFDAKTNIGIGNTENMTDLQKVIAAAEKSGAHEFIEEYEDQYDQILNKAFGGIKPSWGQWQRIALARAFFKDAPILILDEPTSAIDPKAEFEIFERLFEFASGKTVLIISHRFSTVRNADRILVFDKGRVVEDGTHERLMNIPGGKYKKAFEIQRKGYE